MLGERSEGASRGGSCGHFCDQSRKREGGFGRRPVETKAAILEYECGDTGVPFYPVGVSYPGPDPKVLTLDLLELSSA